MSLTQAEIEAREMAKRCAQITTLLASIADRCAELEAFVRRRQFPTDHPRIIAGDWTNKPLKPDATSFSRRILLICQESAQPLMPRHIALAYRRHGWPVTVGKGKTLADIISSRLPYLIKKGKLERTENGYVLK